MKIINPANEELLCELEEDNRQSLAEKFNLLRSAQLSWAKRTLEERTSILQRFSDLLESNMEPLAATLTSETGKPRKQARSEIAGAVKRISWITRHAEQYLRDEFPAAEGPLQQKISYEPLGIVCNISAWNYPYLVGVNVFVPALLAGNAVMYKPSELATLTGFKIAGSLREAGLPEELFQVAAGGRETGEQLLEMDFDGYFFTGSYATGKYIYERVANKMVPCQLELGGKDPLYVADDVKDIEAVAAATADGAFYNNGQSCCSVERIYVHEAVFDRYLIAFATAVQSWKAGDPTTEEVYFGPLTRDAQRKVLEDQIADAVGKGALVVSGGKRMPGKGYYFEPTVLTLVNHEMKVMREESFGPVIGIMKVRDDRQALELMNDTEYGLTASVYSSDKARAEAILEQINAGTGYWNCCDRVSAALPWSGRKHSGIGATLSHQGIRAFAKPKAWHLQP